MAEPTDSGSERPLRADAERNRSAIVDAARRVFAAQGLDAPVSAVAREAGVGVATLYRRFPTRADLTEAAFEQTVAAYVDAVEQALDDPDPWSGFSGHIERICAMQADDRVFSIVLTMMFSGTRQYETERLRAYTGLAELIERAQKTGRLRPDFTPEDVALVLMANAGVIGATGRTTPRAGRRLVGYLLEAFGSGSPGTLPPAPSAAEMYRALLRQRRPPP